MSRTRIVIFQLKEIIYTAIFAGLGILLLILLFFMFWPDKEKDSADVSSPSSISKDRTEDSASTSSGTYIAGIYTSELKLGDSTLDLQVSLDEDRVKSVEIINLKESVETMYPLIKPAVKDISDQLTQNVSPEEVVLSDDSPYTSQLILDTVCQIMEEASAKK